MGKSEMTDTPDTIASKRTRGCVISPNNGSKVGLKAQKLLAQGIALGNVDKKQSRPERAKALILKAFALSIIFALGKIKR